MDHFFKSHTWEATQKYDTKWEKKDKQANPATQHPIIGLILHFAHKGLLIGRTIE